MSSVDNRNSSAKEYVASKLAIAACRSLDTNFQKKYAEANKILDELIPINANGFRGVVLTVIVGIHLDPKFDPTKNFYDCNPRSIFEKGIYYALTEYKIPCGKSDPLNVAKNTQQLDQTWAKGKRPEKAAMAAVRYINLLCKNKGNGSYADLVELFFKRLFLYGQLVQSQNVSISYSRKRFNGVSVADKLSQFVIDCPEGGSIPQFIVGLLIKKLRENNLLYRSVEGYNESVFGTNTTSKKPADVWEVLSSGKLGKLYEITVKIIDKKRLDDCVESLSTLKLHNNEVIFICNIPQNITSLKVTNQNLNHNGVDFQFVDIAGFIRSTYILLSEKQQNSYVKELQEFIFATNRAIKTKQYWAKHFVNQ